MTEAATVAAAITTTSTEATAVTATVAAVATTVATTTAAKAAAAAATTAASAAAHEQAGRRLRRRGHTPAELSEPVGTLKQTLLVAIPLEAAEQTAESSVELVRVDLLVSLSNVLEDRADVLGNLGGLAHVDLGSLKLGCSVDERQAAEAAADLALLERCEDNPALALFACASSAAETMNVGLAVAGETDLDDVADIGEIHASCCDIG